MSSTEATQPHGSPQHKQAHRSLILLDSGVRRNDGFRPASRLINCWAIALLSMPMIAQAEQNACPILKGNPLQNVRLFAGPTSEKAELVPDDEGGATWDIRGYKSSEQPSLILLCEYKNGQSIEVAVNRSAERCYVKGRKRITAWCGK